jgi:hypothetical protein
VLVWFRRTCICWMEHRHRCENDQIVKKKALPNSRNSRNSRFCPVENVLRFYERTTRNHAEPLKPPAWNARAEPQKQCYDPPFLRIIRTTWQAFHSCWCPGNCSYKNNNILSENLKSHRVQTHPPLSHSTHPLLPTKRPNGLSTTPRKHTSILFVLV